MELSDLIWRDHLSSYDSRAHSVRLNGMVTSIRLEDVYWTILAEISEANALTTSQLISRLHEEMLEVQRAVPNLASLLRVTCLRYLSLKLSQAAEVKEFRLARHLSSRTSRSTMCGRDGGARSGSPGTPVRIDHAESMGCAAEHGTERGATVGLIPNLVCASSQRASAGSSLRHALTKAAARKPTSSADIPGLYKAEPRPNPDAPTA